MPKNVLASGVVGLDLLLGGGIPVGPGSGKTVLASQIAFTSAAKDTPVVLATTTSESQSKLIHDLQGFGFFNPDVIGNEVFFLSIYPWLKVLGPVSSAEGLLTGQARQVRGLESGTGPIT